MITIHDRLKIYERMLNDFENKSIYTQNGFCYYIDRVYHIHVYRPFIFLNVFPELYVTQPDNKFDLFYWFPRGDYYSRINCLKKAIEFTEQRIKQL